jgi:hypothetical protein
MTVGVCIAYTKIVGKIKDVLVIKIESWQPETKQSTKKRKKAN